MCKLNNMEEYIYALWQYSTWDYSEPSHIISYHKTLSGAYKAKKQRLLNDYNRWYNNRRRGEDYQIDDNYSIDKITIEN